MNGTFAGICFLNNNQNHSNLHYLFGSGTLALHSSLLNINFYLSVCFGFFICSSIPVIPIEVENSSITLHGKKFIEMARKRSIRNKNIYIHKFLVVGNLK